MSIQAKHADIEWRRMADHDAYYPLRDGPREHKADWVIERMRKSLPDDHVALAGRLAALHAQIRAGGNGNYEIVERVQGGLGATAVHATALKRSSRIKVMAGFEGAAMMASRHGFACLRGICELDTTAAMRRRLRLPDRSHRLKNILQATLMALQEHSDAQALDACAKLGQESRR